MSGGCGVQAALAALDDQERQELEELLDASVELFGHEAISRALKRPGRDVRLSSRIIRRHRAGDCACEASS